MTAKQQEQMPDEVWMWKPSDGSIQKSVKQEPDIDGDYHETHTKYVRADLCAPTDKEELEQFKMKHTIQNLNTPFDHGYMHGYNAAIDYNANIIMRPSREAQLLEVIRDLDNQILLILDHREWTDAQDKHAAIIEESNNVG